MEKENLDIRIIQLAKWQIPKSKSMLSQMEEGEGTHLAIGYFDMIEIVSARDVSVETQPMDAMHPLTRAYYSLPRHGESDASEEYTMQELILFMDIEEGDGSEKIERFWNDDSLLMYISLIHVDNESDIEQIIARIHEEFADQQYLCYFSFDYSGIVLLAKNMKIEAYTATMFRLNYIEAKSGKVIRDSFSMFGLNKKRLAEYFRQAEQGYESIMDVPENEIFSVVVNIGVQNFNTYKKFIAEVEKAGAVTRQCGLLGRHDVSIINDKCDLKWLIYLQYLLNKYTTNGQDANCEQLFSTYETFVKVKMPDELADTEGSGKDIYYDRVKEKLDNLCSEFSAKLAEKKEFYNGEYQIPVRAVKHSVLSILKNRFAEDFVLCMYASFCETLLYLIRKMSLEKDDPEAFEACYGEYFRGLNSLVNSAMHSERQFIQATAFNALIYDVPSKIMAFYVAIIHDIQEIIKNERDKKYTFLLTPSFSNEICVKTISYQREDLPHDRILMVSINERSLYNPRGVVRRMAHEVAHYVGDEIRDRSYRKERFERSVIHIILNGILHSAFIEVEEFYLLVEEIRSSLPGDMRFNQGEMNYSEDLTRVGAQIVEEFIWNQEILKCLDEHIRGIIEDIFDDKGAGEKKEQIKDYVSEIIVSRTGNLGDMFGAMLKAETWSETEKEIMVNWIMRDVKEKINYINRDQRQLLSLGEVDQSVALRRPDDILTQKTIGEFAAALKATYSETFADVQMIILLDFGYRDYLNGFLLDERLDLEKLPKSLENLSRISMVALTMNLAGIWDELTRPVYFGDSDSKLQKLHRIVCCECDAMMQTMENMNMKNSELLQEKVREFKHQVNVKGKDKDERKNDCNITDEAESVDDRMSNAYINNQLFQYLMVCTGNSIMQYLNKDKIEKIKKLRGTIDTVINCKNIRETFEAVCTEVKEYRETIFS